MPREGQYTGSKKNIRILTESRSGTKYKPYAMPNTYTQIHIQTIFAVKKRTGLIQKEWKDEFYKYIKGIIQHHDHKLLTINGMPDHLHAFFGMRANPIAV